MDQETLSMEEWEVIAFFGGDHVSREYGTDWYDSDSVYEVNYENGLKVTCAIHPIHKDVRVCIYQGGVKFFDWQGVSLKDICYIEEKSRTLVKFISQSSDIMELEVQPKLSINFKSGEL